MYVKNQGQWFRKQGFIESKSRKGNIDGANLNLGDFGWMLLNTNTCSSK
jgi:hypothetical protein